MSEHGTVAAVSDPKPPIDLPIETYRGVISDLLAAWDSLERHETRTAKVPTASIVFALTAQAHSMAKAAVYLWDGGYLVESMPVVRTCFESAIYAVWVQQHGQAGVEAYLHERARVSEALVEQCDKAGVPVPDEIREAVSTAPQRDLRPKPERREKQLKAQARKIDQACGSLRGGTGIYLLYRQLSDETHASIGLIRHFVRSPGDEIRAIKQPDSGVGAQLLAASLAAVSLVWAGRALSELGMHKPNKPILRAAARKLGVPPVLLKA